MTKTCSIPNCEDPVRARGMCANHYRRDHYRKIRDGERKVGLAHERLPSQCTREGCGRKAIAKGLCASHYNSERVHRLSEARKSTVRVCADCGTSFFGRDVRAIYCSRECKDRASSIRRGRQPGREMVCLYCGKECTAKRSDSRFCSDGCGRAYRLRQLRKQTTCDACGADLPKGRGRFCSDECKGSFRRAEKYGLTNDELHALIVQHSVCAICGSDKWEQGQVVDHDHATGAVRGVLCGLCNRGLGHFRDNSKFLRSAIAYLERVPAG